MTIVGIDLGTTNSAIAINDGDVSRILPNKEGDNTTPSVVAYLDDEGKEKLVGPAAKNQATSNPTRTIASVKRVMGLRVKEVPDEVKHVSYNMVGRPNDPVAVLIGKEKIIMPQEVSSEVLKKLKADAEEASGETITDAVITVPAYFNDGQRQATKLAGKLAGLNVRRIINEPTAAALAYGFRETGEEAKIAVFDLGGGTFDISILEMGSGVIEVKATNGDTFLGGDDFDREIVNLLVRHFLNEFSVDLRANPVAMQRLKEAAEKAKHSLSSEFTTKISEAFLNDEEQHLELELTRPQFEALIEKYLNRVEVCCKKALKDAGLTAKDVDAVVMVGGSTRVPAVNHLAKTIFEKEPDTSLNPDEVVAIGASIQGAILAGDRKDMILVDVTPLSLGIETEHEEMDVLIERNTPIPTIRKEIYTTTDDDQSEVEVFVWQGEHKRATKNRLLAQFVLTDIEPAMAGDPQIEVTFKIDTDGILQVSARNVATGAIKNITIKDSTSVSEADIQKMKLSAFEASEEDEDYIETMEILEAAEAMLTQTEEGIEELQDMDSPQELVTMIENARDKTSAAIEVGDLDQIEDALLELQTIWENVSSSLE
jgi:molecular chaperone DnaK